jgi:predicted metal-binding protein
MAAAKKKIRAVAKKKATPVLEADPVVEAAPVVEAPRFLKCPACGTEHPPMRCPKTVSRAEFEKQLREKQQQAGGEK